MELRVVYRDHLSDICIAEADEEFVEEPENPANEEPPLFPIDYSEELALAETPTALIDRLDILIANGLLEDDTKAIINNAIAQLQDPYQRMVMAMYLILISPDYAILK